MAQLKKFGNTGVLFPLAANFTITQLGSNDAVKQTDNLRLLGSLLSECEGMYPSIDKWFKDKVVPGLKTEERIAYVAFEGEKAIASAIMKLGEHAKICHLRVHEDFRDADLGQMFFTQMALEARHHAKDLHFTLPEGLWASHAGFFQSFGFSFAVRSTRQYRNGEGEMACSAKLSTVWSMALSHLPNLIAKFAPNGYSLANDLVLSMKPIYADRVFRKTKTVEIRKSFSGKWTGKSAVVYATHPVSSLMGEVRVSAVTEAEPNNIWEQFGEAIGCSKQDFLAYVSDSAKIAAICLDDVRPYKAPLGLAQMSHLIGSDLKAPQSYCGVGSSDDWARATSVASLLHGRFRDASFR
jgi:predicted transcriptional regulator